MTGRVTTRGVTLIEVTVSTVLVGVLLVAALETLGSAARSAAAAGNLADGWALAEALAAEALAVPYEDPDDTPAFGVETGDGSPTTRAGLDDLDDYHNWSESPPVARDGSALAGYTGWSVTFLVQRVEAAPSDGDAAVVGTDEGVRRLTVRVTDPSGVSLDLVGLRSRYGAGADASEFGLTETSKLTVEVAAGGGATQRAGSQNLNEAAAP